MKYRPIKLSWLIFLLPLFLTLLSGYAFASSITNVTYTPASGNSYAGGSSVSLSVWVELRCTETTGGILQVMPTSGTGISFSPVYRRITSNGWQTWRYDFTVNVPYASGTFNYQFYVQYRPGATSGPLNDSRSGDVVSYRTWSLRVLPPPTTTTTTRPSTTTTIARPDLYISSLTYSPTNPIVGQRVNLYWTAANRGAVASSSCYVGWTLGGVQQPVEQIPGLSPGGSRSNALSPGFTPTTSGYQTILVTVDTYNGITESDETNNSRMIDIDVWPAPTTTTTTTTRRPTTTTTTVLSQILSVGYTPPSGGSANANSSISVRVGVGLQCNESSGGVVQVLPTGGSGIDTNPQWQRISGLTSGVYPFNFGINTPSSAGPQSYSFYIQYRPGVTTGPFYDSRPTDVVRSSGWSVNINTTTTTTTSTSTSTTTSTTRTTTTTLTTTTTSTSTTTTRTTTSTTASTSTSTTTTRTTTITVTTTSTTTTTNSPSQILSVGYTPPSGGSANANSSISVRVGVGLQCAESGGGVVQVLPTGGSGIDTNPQWQRISGLTSGVYPFNFGINTPSSAGPQSYSFYIQYRPGVTTGPFSDSRPTDVVRSSGWSVNINTTTTTTTPTSTSTTTSTTRTTTTTLTATTTSTSTTTTRTTTSTTASTSTSTTTTRTTTITATTTSTTTTTVLSQILSVGYTPPSGGSASANSSISVRVGVGLQCAESGGGVVQVLPTGGSGIDTNPQWQRISGLTSGVYPFNFGINTPSSAGPQSYSFYIQYRPGVTTGPFYDSRPTDVVRSSGWSVNINTTTTTTTSTSTSTTTSTTRTTTTTLTTTTTSTSTTTTTLVSRILNVTFVPPSGGVAAPSTAVGLRASVAVECWDAAGGIIQVLPTSGTGIERTPQWLRVTGLTSGVYPLNFTINTPATAGWQNYEFYVQYRPGATTGPLIDSRRDDVTQTVTWSANIATTTTTTTTSMTTTTLPVAISLGITTDKSSYSPLDVVLFTLTALGSDGLTKSGVTVGVEDPAAQQSRIIGTTNSQGQIVYATTASASAYKFIAGSYSRDFNLVMSHDLALLISASPSQPLYGQNVNFNVVVRDDLGQYISGAKVYVRDAYDGKFKSVGLSDSSGRITYSSAVKTIFLEQFVFSAFKDNFNSVQKEFAIQASAAPVTNSVDIPASAYTFALPVQQDNVSIASVWPDFSGLIAYWDPAIAAYRLYPQKEGYATFNTFKLNQGYIILSDSAKHLTFFGQRVKTSTITLTSGWNLIGNSLNPDKIPMNALAFNYNGTDYSFAKALSNNYITDGFYGLDSSGNWTIYKTLERGRGYYIHANVPLTLKIMSLTGPYFSSMTPEGFKGFISKGDKYNFNVNIPAGTQNLTLTADYDKSLPIICSAKNPQGQVVASSSTGVINLSGPMAGKWEMQMEYQNSTIPTFPPQRISCTDISCSISKNPPDSSAYGVLETVSSGVDAGAHFVWGFASGRCDAKDYACIGGDLGMNTAGFLGPVQAIDEVSDACQAVVNSAYGLYDGGSCIITKNQEACDLVLGDFTTAGFAALALIPYLGDTPQEGFKLTQYGLKFSEKTSGILKYLQKAYKIIPPRVAGKLEELPSKLKYFEKGKVVSKSDVILKGVSDVNKLEDKGYVAEKYWEKVVTDDLNLKLDSRSGQIYSELGQNGRQLDLVAEDTAENAIYVFEIKNWDVNRWEDLTSRGTKYVDDVPESLDLAETYFKGQGYSKVYKVVVSAGEESGMPLEVVSKLQDKGVYVIRGASVK